MTEIKPIAYIRTDLPTKFGIPRQSNVVSKLKGRIVFEEEYRNPDALRGIEQYSHLWLIWQFSENVRAKWSPTVRPPILGGNERVGVFATRSSFRPNALALSCVKLEGLQKTKEEGTTLLVSGIDMMDKTPIFDIKPYIPKWDVKEGARGGFTEKIEKKLLCVEDSQELLNRLSVEKRDALTEILEQDPRPAYQKDPERIYGFPYAGFEVKFQVKDGVLYLLELKDEN